MIALTITGLALAALLPIVRPAPGLSKTPRRVETPALLAFEVSDAPDCEQAGSDSPCCPGRTEEDPADSGNRADEASGSIGWMAARPTGAQVPGRPALSRWAGSIAVRPAPILADRRPRFPFATVKPGLGLSVGLCRLLL